MAFFDEKRKIVDWELLHGSRDNADYLKSEAMSYLSTEYPSFALLFRDTGFRRVFFASMMEHVDRGKGLRAKGFLLVLGDLLESGRIKEHQIEQYVLKDVFPRGIPEVVKRMFIYRETSEEAAGDGDTVVTNQNGSRSRSGEAALSEKKGRGIWDYLPF